MNEMKKKDGMKKKILIGVAEISRDNVRDLIAYEKTKEKLGSRIGRLRSVSADLSQGVGVRTSASEIPLLGALNNDEYSRNMYRIETSQGDLAVSPEHKGYVKVENHLSIFDNFSVDIPNPISNNNDSYVHTLTPSIKQSAIKSSSFLWPPNNSFALPRNDLYLFNGTNLIFLNINDDNSLNSFSESLDFANISSLLLRNSSLSFIGANISSLLSNINFVISPCDINVLNNTLESITTFNYTSPLSFSLLCIAPLTFLDNASASFSLNLDLDTNFNAFSSSLYFSNTSNAFSLATSDQFTQGNSFISDLILSGIENVTLAIYNPPLSTICSNFFNCSTFWIIASLNTSDHLIWGNSSSFFFNSSGIDNVTVVMLTPPINYVDTHKYVDIYKPFDKKDLSDFSRGVERRSLDDGGSLDEVGCRILDEVGCRILDEVGCRILDEVGCRILDEVGCRILNENQAPYFGLGNDNADNVVDNVFGFFGCDWPVFAFRGVGCG